MTNHWTDIANATLVFAIGCNPAENHPACMAHINNARGSVSQPNKLKAQLIVVDPRATRTALQADRHIRIRPGTDIAFMNGVMDYMIKKIELMAVDNPIKVAFKAFLNDKSASRTFTPDNGVAGGSKQGEVSVAWPKYTDALLKVADGVGTYTLTGTQTFGGYAVTGLPELASTVDDPECVYQRLKEHVNWYDTATVANICRCSAGDIEYAGDAIIDNSRCSSTGRINTSTYRSTTLLYAMGATQHTIGSENIRSYAVMQSMFGNMGRAGGGINALRGIHNVQGSTDMGNLFDSIPGYSGNPKVGQDFPTYLNTLFGWRTKDVPTATPPLTKSVDPYVRADLGMQQSGFFNMTHAWFGDRTINPTTVTQAQMDAWFGVWPRGDGTDHISSFTAMSAGTIKACYVMGQNPAVTEPNQSAVRAGLKALDLLVVQDIYETETAACDRKSIAGGAASDGITYLLPACAHVEEAGSVTNSGRWLQWRDRATAPKGNSRSDIEYMLRLAKAFNDAHAFSHIEGANVWAADAAYLKLYSRYGWTPSADTNDFEALSLDERVSAGGASRLLYGNEVVAQNVYKEICSPLMGVSTSDPLTCGSTMWIYYEAYNTNLTASQYETINGSAVVTIPFSAWTKNVKARNRDNTPGPALTYARWGWAWLKNRRVFYNNGEVEWDVSDNFVNAGYHSRLFLNDWKGTGSSDPVEWTGKFSYRSFKVLKDKPTVGYGTIGGRHEFARHFPAHTEPYETPEEGLAAIWGKNSTTGTSEDLVPSGTLRGTVADYPLMLTTIRCVEHFQGGPITRNNSWNVEAEPVPWIEINSIDAAAAGIADGDWVNVTTARGNSGGSQTALSQGGTYTRDASNPVDNFGLGFKARVGVGLQSNQRVTPGLVAIPWHWGDKGLSTGSRANDLCIDASDANTKIPEYKICLCKIAKM